MKVKPNFQSGIVNYWKKTLLVMKISVFLLLLALQVSAKDYAQETISINSKKSTLIQVFKAIEKQSSYRFYYSDDLVPANEVVTVAFKNASINEVMNRILVGLNLNWKLIEDKLVVISTVDADNRSVFTPEKILNGTVKSNDGIPLQGASIKIKGTDKITTTDAFGNFKIPVADKDLTLVISYAGYTTKEIAINKKGLVDIVLVATINNLQDVVVVGYGTAKKRDLTGSTASVKAADLKDVPVSGFDEAMSGKMAGIRVSNSNPAPGSGQNVIIRGIGSISASPAPLYIIDGMPMPESYDRYENPLNTVNTNDIESIEVLKDASATAIYGARASNGVILITTKRGKNKKAQISFSSNIGSQEYANKIKMLNTTDYLKYIADSRSQSYVTADPYQWDDSKRSYSWSTPDAVRLQNLYGMGYITDPRQERWFVVSDALKSMSNINTNWMDQILQTGVTQNYQLSATGGNEVVSYMVSGNYLNQKGIVKTSGYERYGVRANIDIKASSHVRFGVNLAPSYEKFNLLSNMESTEGPTNMALFPIALMMPPLYQPYDSLGNINFTGSYTPSPYEFNIATPQNPLSQLGVTTVAYNMRTMGSIFGEVSISKNFTFRSELNTDIKNTIQNYFLPSTTYTGSARSQVNTGTINNTNRVYLNSQNYVTYNGKLKLHSLNVVVGYQAEKNSWKNSYIKKQNFIVDNISSLNTGGTILNPLTDATTNVGADTYVGMFARATYNYNSKYYLTVNFRRDGSSKFGVDNLYGNFPSFSAAWRISDEKFFPEKIKAIISDWKIRGGWGIVGNSSIADFQAYNRLNTGSYMYGNGTTPTAAVGMSDAGIAFKGLGWESTKDLSIGTDIQLLNGRVNVEYDYYVRHTSNMLYNVSLMAITGFGSQTRNVSAMENRGMEFAVSSRNFIGKFSWNTKFNIYYNRNKVLDLGPNKNPIYGGVGTDNTITVEGKPLSNFWGYQYLGPFKSWQDVKNNPNVNGAQGLPNPPASVGHNIPGDAMYKDVNGDGIIDANDFTIIGNPQPDFVYGITNTFAFKNFDMSIQINGVQGGDQDMRTFKRETFGGNGGQYNIPYFYFDNYWRPDRINAKYETPNRKSGGGKQFYNSSENIEKGTYLSINNITLGYTVPANILNKAKIASLRIYMSVQNALMITKYHGWNPESNTGGINATQQGVDETGYPYTRTIAFGLNLNL